MIYDKPVHWKEFWNLKKHNLFTCNAFLSWYVEGAPLGLYFNSIHYAVTGYWDNMEAENIADRKKNNYKKVLKKECGFPASVERGK